MSMNYNIIERMRDHLRPKGTAPIVQLFTQDSSGMWLNAEFVTKCINELDRMHVRVACGDGPTNLEKLAYMLLCESAYIDIKTEEEREIWLALQS
jgi:hypothetical protein